MSRAKMPDPGVGGSARFSHRLPLRLKQLINPCFHQHLRLKRRTPLVRTAEIGIKDRWFLDDTAIVMIS